MKNRAGDLFRLAAFSLLHHSPTPLGNYLRRMKAKLGPRAATRADAGRPIPVDLRSWLFYDGWRKEAPMPNKKPTHEQAQLQLQLYDLRREAKLRQARDWFNQNFFADSFEDCMRVAPMGSQEGTYLWMVLGYWDQACALLNNGLLHEELFFQTAGEFFGVWERVKAMVPSARQMFHQKLFLLNLEQAAQRFEKWMNKTSPGAVEAMRQWMKQMGTEKTKKAGA